MLVMVAVLASLTLIGWLVLRAVRQKPVKAHTVSRTLAYLAGVYTYAFFLSMDTLSLWMKRAGSFVRTELSVKSWERDSTTAPCR